MHQQRKPSLHAQGQLGGAQTPLGTGAAVAADRAPFPSAWSAAPRPLASSKAFPPLGRQADTFCHAAWSSNGRRPRSDSLSPRPSTLNFRSASSHSGAQAEIFRGAGLEQYREVPKEHVSAAAAEAGSAAANAAEALQVSAA